MRALIFVLLLIPIIGISQTKKELADQIIRKQKSIDSLQKIIDNQENIIENRDRTVLLTKQHRAEMMQERDEANYKFSVIEKKLAKLARESKMGSAQMMMLANNRNIIKVKPGKTVTINQIITDYSAGIKTDSLGNESIDEIHIFIKAINGNVLTDKDKGMYGPQVYSSTHPEHAISFPMVLTEGTSFSIVLMKGEMNNLTPYEGKAYCSYTEK
jgi:hypothetical protein